VKKRRGSKVVKGARPRKRVALGEKSSEEKRKQKRQRAEWHYE